MHRDKRPAGVDIVGLGEISVDERVIVDAPLSRGGKVRARQRTLTAGGQVATAMLAVQRLGLRARYIGAVGHDELAELALAALRSADVQLDVQVVAGARTRSAWIFVDDDGERTIIEHRDSRTTLDAQRIDREALVQARALHLDATDIAAARETASWARAAGLSVALDLDRLDEASAPLLPLVDLLVASEAVLFQLDAAGDHQAALDALARRAAPGALVCLTRGARGAVARRADGVALEVPAFPVHAIDTTGCGDVFRAALLVAHLEGADFGAALRFASAAGALQATKQGVQDAVPSRAEVERLLAG